MLKITVTFLLCLGLVNLGEAYDKYATIFKNGNPDQINIKSDPFVKISDGYYYFGTEGVNWYVAYEKCRALGSELVTFETSEEFEAIAKYLKYDRKDDRYNYWTSGNDLGTTGTHNWFTSGQRISIPKWAPGQPDNARGGEHCIHMGYIYRHSTGFELNDKPCVNDVHSLFRYVCEAPKQETISIVVWK